jgi:hypothetical protein
VSNASTGNGQITITSNSGDLTAGTITAGGVGANVQLKALNSGSVFVGNVTAVGDSIIITAIGSVEEFGNDAAADLTASAIQITAFGAVGGLDALETAATNFNIVVRNGDSNISNNAGSTTTLANFTTGTGALKFVQNGGGDLIASNALTVLGHIELDNMGASINAVKVRAGGNAKNVTLKTMGSGNLTVDLVTASRGTITINAAGQVNESGSDSAADLVASTLAITAGGGVGVNEAIETAAGSISVSSSGSLNLANTRPSVTTVSSLTASGAIVLNQNGGGALVVSSVTTTGPVNVAVAGASLTVGSISATSGSVSLSADADVNLDSVTSATSITVSAGGQIVESPADSAVDLSAPTLALSAGAGIGAANAIEIAASNISATSGAGAVNLSNSGSSAVTVSNISTGAGSLAFTHTGAGTLSVTSASTANGAIAVSAIGGSLNVTGLVAGGVAQNVSLSASAGNITVGSATALGNSITVTASGQINELGSDSDADFSAGTLTLSAGTGIGVSGSIETAATTVFASSSSGPVNYTNTPP